MTLRLIQILALLMVASFAALGQSASELESRYNSPVKAYQVRPGIWLTASFGEGGSACEMIIEKRRTTGSTIDHAGLLSSSEVDEVLNELVPLGKRGRAAEFSGITERRLGGATTWYDYEKVRITKLGVLLSSTSTAVKGYLAILIEWKQSKCKQN